MAAVAQTNSKASDGHVAPKRRAKYASPGERGAPKMTYFDKKGCKRR